VGTQRSGTQALQEISALVSKHRSIVPTLVQQFGERDAFFEGTIRGGSMSPAIPANSRLLMKVCADHACARGDIIYYWADDRFVVHRVLYCARRYAAAAYVLTFGDGCLVPDAPVKNEQIVGTVISVRIDGNWYPPGPPVYRSACHRLVRRMTAGLVIFALMFGVSAARGVTIFLRRMEGSVRAASGRWLRRLHLIPPLDGRERVR
jgi:hypothetical protein